MVSWSVGDTSMLLSIWRTKTVQLLLNYSNPFSEIVKELMKHGVAQYDARDVRIQLDYLTKQYHAAKLNNNAAKFMFYDVMDNVFKGVDSTNDKDLLVEDSGSLSNPDNGGTSGSESKSLRDLSDSVHSYSRQFGEHCALIRCSENFESPDRLTFYVEGSKILQNAVFQCLGAIESAFNELLASKQCADYSESNGDDQPIGENEKPGIIQGFFSCEEDSANLDDGDEETPLPAVIKREIESEDEDTMNNHGEPQNVDFTPNRPLRNQAVEEAENGLQEKESKNEDSTANNKSHESLFGNFICDICSANFTSKRRYDCHMIRHAKLKKALICSMCKAQFDNEGQLSEHEVAKNCLVQQQSRKSAKKAACHLCQSCHAVYRTRDELRSHRKKEHCLGQNGESCKSHACQTCRAVFGTRDELRAHRRKDHGIVQSRESREKTTNHACQTCHVVFRTREELRSHRKKEHDVVQARISRNVCYVCQAVFRNRDELRIHAKVHNVAKTCVCDQCNTSHSTEARLASHIRSKHSKEKPLRIRSCVPSMCDICGKVLSSKHALVAHMQTMHLGFAVTCDICGLGFSKNAYMMSHRRLHTGETPYPCPDCDKAFRSVATLNVHRKTHTDIRPFECPHCDMKFRRSEYLKQHIGKHTGEKPHQCLFCSYRSRLSSTRLKHMRVRHGYQAPLKPWRIAATITTSSNAQASQESLDKDVLSEAN